MNASSEAEVRLVNHHHKTDSNAMYEMHDSESPETRQQLDELEQQLRVACPQPPGMDVAALMREADHRRAQRRAVAVRRGLWFGGTWACGAAIGAATMFVLLSRVPSRAGPDPTVEVGGTATAWQAQTPVASPAENPQLEATAAHEPGDAASLLALDLLDAEGSSYLANGATMHVGMSLPRRAGGDSQDLTRRNGEWSTGDEQKRFVPDAKATSHPAASAPITREKLMQELLEGPIGAVL